MNETLNNFWNTFKTRTDKFATTFANAALDCVFGERLGRSVVGSGPIKIAPGKTEAVLIYPQCLFRGEKLINTGDCDGLFVQGIFVGTMAQFPSQQGPIAVATFSPEAVDNDLIMNFCARGEMITLAIINTDKVERTFSMSIIGTSRKPRYQE